MKRSSNKQTADILENRICNLKNQALLFDSGDLYTLCEMAQTVVMAEEYWIKSRRKKILHPLFPNELTHWYRNIYANQICLVLNLDDKYYGYDRRYVLKRLRGVIVHSDEKDRNAKDQIFRAFAFEEESPSYFEFALTHKWILTGGWKYDVGNTESRNPFLEDFAINDREPFRISTLESIVLNAIQEFWFISQTGSYINKGRVLMDASRDELVQRFGEKLGGKCYETLRWHKSGQQTAA